MFFVVQAFPNDSQADKVVVLGLYKKHGAAIKSLSEPSGKHIELARLYPDAKFVVRRVVGERSSVRNTYTSDNLPDYYSTQGHAPADGAAKRKGKIGARSFGSKRWDGFDRQRSKVSHETLASNATIRKFPVDESYRSYGR